MSKLENALNMLETSGGVESTSGIDKNELLNFWEFLTEHPDKFYREVITRCNKFTVFDIIEGCWQLLRLEEIRLNNTTYYKLENTFNPGEAYRSFNKLCYIIHNLLEIARECSANNFELWYNFITTCLTEEIELEPVLGMSKDGTISSGICEEIRKTLRDMGLAALCNLKLWVQDDGTIVDQLYGDVWLDVKSINSKLFENVSWFLIILNCFKKYRKGIDFGEKNGLNGYLTYGEYFGAEPPIFKLDKHGRTRCLYDIVTEFENN